MAVHVHAARIRGPTTVCPAFVNDATNCWLEWWPISRRKSRLGRKILAPSIKSSSGARSPLAVDPAGLRGSVSSSLMPKLGYQSRSVGRSSRTIESSAVCAPSNPMNCDGLSFKILATWLVSHFWLNSTKLSLSLDLIGASARNLLQIGATVENCPRATKCATYSRPGKAPCSRHCAIKRYRAKSCTRKAFKC